MAFAFGDDIIDSRDIVARIDELTELDEPSYELEVLTSVVDQINDYGGDSAEDGITLILDGYFMAYAMELADDIGAIDRATSSSWPNYCIDWEWAARELRMDYTAVIIDGLTYWYR